MSIDKIYKCKRLSVAGKMLVLGFGPAMILFSVFGCSSPRGELFAVLDEPLLWPGPPDKARISFVGTVSTEDDLKKEVSWTEGFVRAIFGKEDRGVLLGPYGLFVCDDGHLFVADPASGTVQLFDLEERDYLQFSEIGDGESLSSPVAVSVIDEQVYVVDSTLHQVCVFNGNGKYVSRFGRDELKRPSGIAYNALRGEIFVSDTAEHNIKVFADDGEYLRSIGSRGVGDGEFNYPTHLWFGNGNRLYVSDTLNYRVQVFDSRGEFVLKFGEQGDRPGNFAHPSGIATDSVGNIYVVDRQFENIQVFDPDGRILMALGSEGSGPGQFWLPGGIFIDHNNRIYVADSFNKRVQVFQLLESN